MSLIDSTLREGAQTVGVSFDLAQKKNIFDRLSLIGIEEIELGIASPMDHDLPQLMRHARTSDYPGRLALWSRCWKEDIEFAARLRPDVLSLSIPGSDLHIAKKLGRDRAWVLKTIRQSAARAFKSGLCNLSLGIEDATRTDPGFLQKNIQAAHAAGIGRIRLADTVGIATPGEIADLVAFTKDSFPGEVGVHCHNDFGMATANSLSALTAGANWADVTVYGVGERAGNARLEELAGYLALRQGGHYRLDLLATLVREVAELCQRPIDPHHPVVGEKIFQCETGLHLQGLVRNPATYEPYAPEKVGARRELFFGGKIGKKEIRDCLGEQGRKPSRHQLDKLVREIRGLMIELGRPLRKKEFSTLLVYRSGL